MKKLFFILGLLYSAQSFSQSSLKYDFVVAKDGSGNFNTVQDAINAVPDYRKKRTFIFIKKGTYKEKLILPESKSFVAFIGESRDSTILTYDDYAKRLNCFGEEKGTSGSSSFYVYGTDFRAENITFENSAGPVGQAVAILVKGDRAAFTNCRFLGFQDTLYAYGDQCKLSRQYYKNCYIQGTVDFIFGWATAWFEGCTLYGKHMGHYTAASTPQNIKYGFVFNRCRITGEENESRFDLGRPWRPYASVIFMYCEMGKMVKPQGWDNWDNSNNEKTVRFTEYKNTGAGADFSKRVPWVRLLTDEEVKSFTIANVLGEEDKWDPEGESK